MYYHAVTLGLPEKAGGYSVSFLKNWLEDQLEQNLPHEIKILRTEPFNMDYKVIENLIDMIEDEYEPITEITEIEPKKLLIEVRQTLKNQAACFDEERMFRYAKAAVKRMDNREGLTKSRGVNTWQKKKLKMSQRERRESTRAYKRRKYFGVS